MITVISILIVVLIVLYIIWVRYDPKLDYIKDKKKGKSHLILWYDDHYWGGGRKYVILL